MRTLLEEAISEYFGERCPDFEPWCPCCRAWAEFDEIERLRAALKDARVSVQGWADYASDYIKEKWDLKGDLARIDAALNGEEGK